MNLEPGRPTPLGATVDGQGTNFAVFSGAAERIELCLFDGDHETRIALPGRTDHVWHGYAPRVGPGQRYGYRVHGSWEPEGGRPCNPANLLLDPYAKSVAGEVLWDDSLFPFRSDRSGWTKNDKNTAPFVPRAVVSRAEFDWDGDRPPRTPWDETIIYETHVKGFTATHPDVPRELRGTFAGLAHPAAVGHLKRLGVTAVELLPVHQFLHERALTRRGLRNYWGYMTLGYFAPHNEYCATRTPEDRPAEFKEMVKTLHAAGIEVLLDVVYNHTGEGNHKGPVLSWKGIDNATYYRLDPQTSRYVDITGTGNTVNVPHPQVLRMILDSLRYWILEMHVDGFRLDQATTLGRNGNRFDPSGPFFEAVRRDPVISTVKLIAEPWDLGDHGYQVGNFPPPFSEWNGKFRDGVRDYWKGSGGGREELAARITGSTDLYGRNGRGPLASVNYVTAHDGFTLEDLVCYNEKHNEANGEGNRDGEDDNRSFNFGVEGPTDDPEVRAARAQQKRNFLATLLLSQGVPMLSGGDEIGRTQRGNNNAYCHDSDLSWYDWSRVDGDLLEFASRLIELRREHPVFRKRHALGPPRASNDGRDIAWFTPEGREMLEKDWSDGSARSLGVLLGGTAEGATSPASGPSPESAESHLLPADDSFYILFNASADVAEFTLPSENRGRHWVEAVDTARPTSPETRRGFRAGEAVAVRGRSLLVLRCDEPS